MPLGVPGIPGIIRHDVFDSACVRRNVPVERHCTDQRLGYLGFSARSICP